MEEELFWRLERNEGTGGPNDSGITNNGGNNGAKGPDNGGTSGWGSQNMDESPSSPSSPAAPTTPAVKFNGIAVPQPAPVQPPMQPMQPPMQQPMPQAPAYMMETDVTISHMDITLDPGWNITDVLCILYDCSCQCQRALATIMHSPEAPMRARQIALLRDCSEICHTAWCFLQRNSRYSLKVLKLCAQICEACADACSMQLDLESQRCAATCMRCAAACRSFIDANV